jgi:hypothetical protein
VHTVQAAMQHGDEVIQTIIIGDTMTRHDKKSIYNGQNRRVEERRQADRRRSKRYNKIFEIIAIVIVTVLVVKLFHW